MGVQSRRVGDVTVLFYRAWKTPYCNGLDQQLTAW